jgi:hypothetical protein
MAKKLTDVSGIGEKTAEKLKEKGIGSKQELLEEYQRGRPELVGTAGASGLNKRVKKGIRQEITEQGQSFVDPEYGIPVSKDNEKARDAFDLGVGSDVASGFGDFTRENPNYSGSNVLDLAGEALRGDLGPGLSPEEYDDIATETTFSGTQGPRESDAAETAKREAFEFGLDAAANVSEYDRETIERANELSQRTSLGTFTVQQEETVQRETESGTIEASEKRQVPTRNFAKAQQVHKDRSPMARRVDSQRRAKIADDYDQWRSAPDEYDYPGVDTPTGTDDIINDSRREQASQIEEFVSGGDDKVTEIAFGEAIGNPRR